MAVAVILPLMTLSCGSDKNKQSGEGKQAAAPVDSTVYFYNVQVVDEGKNPIAYKDGKKYTGKVWNQDKSYCIDVVDGMAVKSTFYHTTGKVGFEIEHSNLEEEPKFTYYNEEGEEITQDEFFKNYGGNFDKVLYELAALDEDSQQQSSPSVAAPAQPSQSAQPANPAN